MTEKKNDSIDDYLKEHPVEPRTEEQQRDHDLNTLAKIIADAFFKDIDKQVAENKSQKEPVLNSFPEKLDKRSSEK